jgi:hypothetical protein
LTSQQLVVVARSVLESYDDRGHSPCAPQLVRRRSDAFASAHFFKRGEGCPTLPDGHRRGPVLVGVVRDAQGAQRRLGGVRPRHVQRKHHAAPEGLSVVVV